MSGGKVFVCAVTFCLIFDLTLGTKPGLRHNAVATGSGKENAFLKPRKTEADNHAESLRQRTATALNQQAEWLPGAVAAGEWPKDLFAPYLEWSDQYQAFVTNKTNDDIFLKKWPGERSNTVKQMDRKTELQTFLSSMRAVELPAIVSSGSLLAFIREGGIITDDADFLTFHRFYKRPLLQIEKMAAQWDRCVLSNSNAFEDFGYPALPGFEVAFRDADLKIDLFFAEENDDSYSVGFWVKGKLYSCVLPGPTGFAPAMDANHNRFFISTTALLELEYLYGPSWREPYNGTWDWKDSPSSFSSCNMEQAQNPFLGGPLSRTRLRQTVKQSWDEAMTRLRTDMVHIPVIKDCGVSKRSKF